MTVTRRRAVALSFIGLLTAGCGLPVLVMTESRGGGVFSIQNETYAATLETAAGVIAKKLVEHEGFCYFQTIQQSENRNGMRPVTGAIFGPNGASLTDRRLWSRKSP